MIPHNDIERQVVDLSTKLRSVPLSDAVMAWMRTSIPLLAYCSPVTDARDEYRNICVRCGGDMADCLICPHCGQRHASRARPTRRRYRYEYCYGIAQHCKGWQVLRKMIYTLDSAKGYKAHESIDTMCEHWLNDRGQVFRIGCGRNMQRFTPGHDLQLRAIRPNTYGDPWLYQECNYYPRSSFAPWLKMRGISGASILNRLSPVESALQCIIREPHIETLAKSGQWKMINRLIDNNLNHKSGVDNYWPQLCMSSRHGYKIRDIRTWFDQIRLVRILGLDDRSPKYILPSDLNAIHSRLIKMNERRLERIRKQQMVEDIAKSEPAYARKIKPFLGLSIACGDIVIRPLDSIMSFYEEGQALHHCVFTNNYYDDRQSLILSARIVNERVETAEVSLATFTILQCHGLYNKSTPHHNAIIRAINGAMGEIKKLAKFAR